jgi:hypothetical protein
LQDPIFTPIFTALIGTGGFTIGATTITYASLLSGVATAALTAFVGVLLAPTPPKPEDGRAPISQAIPPRIYGYGTARIGGFAMLWEEWRRWLYYVGAIAGHRIHQVRGLWMDDERVTLDEYGFVQRSASKRFGWEYVRVDWRLGLPIETAYDFIAGNLQDSGMYGSDFRGDGQASVGISFRPAKADAFGKVYGGIPRPSLEADLALVWDFRDPLQDPEDESTWTWTTNPVLIIAHYLCFSEFGFRRNYAEAILPVIEQWVQEANICDEPVPRRSGGTEPRYQCAGWFTSENEPKAVLNALLVTCDGWVCERGDGVYLIRVGKYREPEVVLTDADLCGWFLQSDIPSEDAINRLVPRITYPAAEYAPAECDAFEDVDDQLRRGRTLERVADLVTVQEWRQGRRLTKREWSRLQEKVKGALDVRLSGINAIYERWIRIQSNLIPRLNNVVIENRNARIALAQGGFRIEFIKTSDEIDNWDPDTDEGEPPPVPERPSDDELYVPQNVNAVAENISIGPGISGVYLAVSFDDPEEDDLDYVVRYRIKVLSGAQNVWTTLPPFTEYEPESGRITLTTPPVPTDVTLEVEVASKSGSSLSTFSSTEEVTTVGDLVAPAPPEIGTVGVAPGEATIPLTAPNSPNVRAMRVYRAASGDPYAESTDVSGPIYCIANQQVSYVDEDVSSGSYDYFATAENWSSVKSTPAGPEPAIVP